jgi:hypothetical protein
MTTVSVPTPTPTPTWQRSGSDLGHAPHQGVALDRALVINP